MLAAILFNFLKIYIYGRHWSEASLSLSGFTANVLWAHDELPGVSLSFCGEETIKLAFIHSLNAWQNLTANPSKPGESFK